MSDYDDETLCPWCGQWIPTDGMPVVYCPKCKHCSHAMIIDGVCQVCGEGVGDDK